MLAPEINKAFDLNIHPPVNKINNVLIDLMLDNNWKKVAILFEEPSRIEDIVRFASSDEAYSRDMKFIFRIFSPSVNLWQHLLNEIKKTGSMHIIIDLSPKMINEFLKIVIYFINSILLILSSLRVFHIEILLAINFFSKTDNCFIIYIFLTCL